MKIEFLWFDECPNYKAARNLLQSVLQERMIDAEVVEINASEPEIAQRLQFPGSPTIRVEGTDVEPGFVDPGEYAPRCRIYFTASGISGVPPRQWIEHALDQAKSELS